MNVLISYLLFIAGAAWLAWKLFKSALVVGITLAIGFLMLGNAFNRSLGIGRPPRDDDQVGRLMGGPVNFAQ